MFEVISLEAVLIFARGVFLIAACGVLAIAVMRWRKQMELESKRMFEQLDIALVEMRAMQEQMQRLDSRLDALAGQLEAGSRQTAQPTAPAARGYELAVRLAKRGAPIEELIGSCGITRHEAELLVRLHSVRVVSHETAASSPRDTHQSSERKLAATALAPAANTQAAEPSHAPVRKRGSLLAVG